MCVTYVLTTNLMKTIANLDWLEYTQIKHSDDY